jgi:hypothetical protein
MSQSKVLLISPTVADSSAMELSVSLDDSQVIGATERLGLSKVHSVTGEFAPNSNRFERTVSLRITQQMTESDNGPQTRDFAVSILLNSVVIGETNHLSGSDALTKSAEPQKSAQLSGSSQITGSNAIVQTQELRTSPTIRASVILIDSTPLMPSSEPTASLVFIGPSDNVVASQNLTDSPILKSRAFEGSATLKATSRFSPRQTPSETAEGTPLVFQSSAQFQDRNKGKGSPSNPTTVWIGLGAAFGAALLLALLVLLVLFVRRERTPTNPVSAESQASDGEVAQWEFDLSDKFVDYENPCEFSGDDQNSLDDAWEAQMDEGAVP